MMRWFGFFTAVIIMAGCAQSSPFVVKDPPSGPPPVVEKTPSPPVVESWPIAPTWYPDPTRGFVLNATKNVFAEVDLPGAKLPGGRSAFFSLAPGQGEMEIYWDLGTHVPKIKGTIQTALGPRSVGLRYPETIVVTNRTWFYWGYYGWHIIIYQREFPR